MGKRPADLSAFAIPKPPAALPADIDGGDAESSREGGRRLEKKSLQMTPEAIRELAILQAEIGKKQHELLAEALNLLFKKYDKPQLA